MSFGLGAFLSGTNMWFQPVVSLEIINTSEREVTDIKIIWKLDTVRSVTTIPIIKKGKQATLKLVAQGGGLSYKIEYKKEDKILSDISDYVIPGKYSVNLE